MNDCYIKGLERENGFASLKFKDPRVRGCSAGKGADPEHRRVIDYRTVWRADDSGEGERIK